ncbi:MAG TPA: fumarylacetoacetate hydrolase family protein [Acidimicrobiia bacterium]|nr:fumarylacetoacetate hydrolase family protein [Acidimicrobiia bacterium]
MTNAEVESGLVRQLRERSQLIAAGRRPLGWKAGFGAQASLERFRLDGPLIGFMTDASVIADGSEIDIEGWGRAVAEPEIFVVLGADIDPDAGPDAARAAVAALGPALELANIDPPPEDVEVILAGNIFHEGVVLGNDDPARGGADLSGLEARVTVDGQELHRITRLEDLTGRIVDVLSHLAALLGRHGETMRAGDVVICGSVVPPIDLAPGMTVGFELHPMSPISVSIR